MSGILSVSDFLPGNDILRRLPSWVSSEIRLEADTLLFCHDQMISAMNRLRQLCRIFNPANSEVSFIAALFSDAWTIVDQINLFRQILNQASNPLGPVSSAFLADADSARRMRNRIQHIVQHLPNQADVSGQAESLFGCLMFARSLADSLDHARVGDQIPLELICVSRGTIPGLKGGTSAQFSTHDVRRPISNIKLMAFGEALNLEDMVDRATDILQGYSEDIAHQIDMQVPQLARDNGVPESIVRQATPILVTHVIATSIPFGTEEELRDFGYVQAQASDREARSEDGRLSIRTRFKPPEV